MRFFLIFLFAGLITSAAQVFAATEKIAEKITSEEIVQSLGRGANFLIAAQNASGSLNGLSNGSWGSPHNTKGINIYAPQESHNGLRAGTTALALMSLLELESAINKNGAYELSYEKLAVAPESLQAAIERGEKWILEFLPKLKRSAPDTLYNVWGHLYGIQCLVRMLQRFPDDAERCGTIRAHIRFQIERLADSETSYGGWSYYEENSFQHPTQMTISFMTASALIAFHEAAQQEISIPEPLLRRAIRSIQRQRSPNFTYAYSSIHAKAPMIAINRPPASLSRSQSCNLALRLWGDEVVTEDVIREWLERLHARHGWIDLGRKRPIPHEGFYHIAGYFFYYGYYYAAMCVEILPAEEQQKHRDSLAEVILPLQEKDGSWWDFPFYDYHQQYGTAYAIMTLLKCCNK